MRVLIDTHAWLWMQGAPDRLSAATRDLLSAQTTEPVFSVVVAWEIAIKWKLGKLRLPEPPESFLPSRIQAGGDTVLPISLEHAVRVSQLELHHGDPFDRLLIAQALCEDLPVLTADRVFERYPIDVLTA